MSSFSNSLLAQCPPSSSDPSCVPLLPVNRNAKIRKGRKPVPTALCCRDLFPVEDLLNLWTRSSFVFIHGFTFCKDEFGTFQRCFHITPCVLFFDLMKMFFFFSHRSYGRCWESVIGDYLSLRSLICIIRISLYASFANCTQMGLEIFLCVSYFPVLNNSKIWRLH